MSYTYLDRTTTPPRLRRRPLPNPCLSPIKAQIRCSNSFTPSTALTTTSLAELGVGVADTVSATLSASAVAVTGTKNADAALAVPLPPSVPLW